MDYTSVITWLWNFVIKLAEMMSEAWIWLNTNISVLGINFVPMDIGWVAIIGLVVWGLLS